MTLSFRRHDSYGKARWYPVNHSAQAIVALTGRVCLKPQELDMLERHGGFTVIREAAPAPENPIRASDKRASKGE